MPHEPAAKVIQVYLLRHSGLLDRIHGDGSILQLYRKQTGLRFSESGLIRTLLKIVLDDNSDQKIVDHLKTLT